MNSEMTFSLPDNNLFFSVKLKITLRGVFFKIKIRFLSNLGKTKSNAWQATPWIT